MIGVTTASSGMFRTASAVAVVEAMRRSSAPSRFQRVAPLVLTALLLCAGGLAQIIQQFPTALPGSIALGPDGAMWFTQSGKIGRIDASGVGTELPLPAGAWDIALGADGNLWVITAGGIGQMTPAGAFTLFPVAGASQITAGPDGNLWFTKDPDPRIGRITTSGVITEFPLPTNSLPRDITGGPDGNVWFTKPDDKIGRITTSGVVTEFATPTSNTWPYAIAAGPDGNVWFTTSYPGVGRITPTGAITEFPISEVHALVPGADGNLWAAGFGTLKRITPGGSTTVFSIPTATEEWFAASVAMAAAPDGSIWITDYNNSQIVRFSLGASGPIDVSSGSAGESRVLIWDARRLSVRRIDASGEETSSQFEGPYSGWTAMAIAEGDDGRSRVLWRHGDGRAGLEIVGPSGGEAVFRFAGSQGWRASDISVGADGEARLLWTSTDGSMLLASVDSAGVASSGPQYGPYRGWAAVAISDGPDGSTWVLWRNSDGRASASSHSAGRMGTVFRWDSHPGWAAEDLAVGADGRLRLLWTNPDGRMEISTVDAAGQRVATQTYASPGLQPQRIAAGADGLTRVLWSAPDGRGAVWLLHPDNSLESQHPIEGGR